MLESIRLCLLQTQHMESWKDLPAYFYLAPVSDESFDLIITAIPGHALNFTEAELTLQIPEQVNSMQTDFTLGEGRVLSGNCKSGVIRFQYKRK